MKEYKQPELVKANALDDKATELYAEGATDGSRADDYVRTTVFLATVLFLVGISGHFRVRVARYGLVGGGHRHPGGGRDHPGHRPQAAGLIEAGTRNGPGSRPGPVRQGSAGDQVAGGAKLAVKVLPGPGMIRLRIGVSSPQPVNLGTV